MERMNKTLIEVRSKHVSANQRDWDDWLPLVLFGYRTSRQASTGESPHQLLFGRRARLPVDVELDSPLPQPQLTTEFSRVLGDKMGLSRKLLVWKSLEHSAGRRDPTTMRRRRRLVSFRWETTFGCTIQLSNRGCPLSWPAQILVPFRSYRSTAITMCPFTALREEGSSGCM